MGVDTLIYNVLTAGDATAGIGKDNWTDFETQDKIQFGAGFFTGLLASDLSDAAKVEKFISVSNDANGNAVLKIDRDGDLATYGKTDLLVLENQAGLTLQQLLDNHQIIISWYGGRLSYGLICPALKKAVCDACCFLCF